MVSRFKVKLSRDLKDSYGQLVDKDLGNDLVVWDLVHEEWVVAYSMKDIDRAIELCDEWNEEHKAQPSLRLVK